MKPDTRPMEPDEVTHAGDYMRIGEGYYRLTKCKYDPGCCRWLRSMNAIVSIQKGNTMPQDDYRLTPDDLERLVNTYGPACDEGDAVRDLLLAHYELKAAEELLKAAREVIQDQLLTGEAVYNDRARAYTLDNKHALSKPYGDWDDTKKAKALLDRLKAFYA